MVASRSSRSRRFGSIALFNRHELTVTSRPLRFDRHVSAVTFRSLRFEFDDARPSRPRIDVDSPVTLGGGRRDDPRAPRSMGHGRHDGFTAVGGERIVRRDRRLLFGRDARVVPWGGARIAHGLLYQRRASPSKRSAIPARWEHTVRRFCIDRSICLTLVRSIQDDVRRLKTDYSRNVRSDGVVVREWRTDWGCVRATRFSINQ